MLAGSRLHAIESGSGPPVCLLHGLFGRAQNFGLLARHLSVTYRVISLDLRNHGASPHTPGMAYADMAADVLHTLAEMSALPCRLLGHSMGGKVAMAACLAAPGAVSRLVVADIAPVAYHHNNAAIAAALLALPLTPGLDRRTADAALAATVPNPATRGFLLQNLAFGATPAWKNGLAEIAGSIATIEDWPADFANARYDNPTLFVAGALSDYLSAANTPAITQLFPRARLVTLPGAGHWLHADQPERFAGLVETFLAE